MAMTIGEAQDVQWVIGFLLGHKDIDRAKFDEALIRLAGRSSRVLMAGETAETLAPKIKRRRLARSTARD